MAKAKKSAQKIEINRIIRALKVAFPNSKCALEHQTPFQLLVATVLSAQCTDVRVNQVTPGLFSKYPDSKSMSQARLSDLEKMIRPTGFYKSKALALKSLSETIEHDFNGEVPKSHEKLVRLRGVGNKTANVVLGVAYGIPAGIVVDTHVKRISFRIGLTRHKGPEKIAIDLQNMISKSEWIIISQLFIDLGRKTCTARPKPKCAKCPINRFCQKIGV